jgi:hypothetical protein
MRCGAPDELALKNGTGSQTGRRTGPKLRRMESGTRSVCWLLMAGWATLAAVGQTTATQPSDDDIRRLLMQQSVAVYSGSCPCPNSRNRGGARCGGNSAYSRPGGERPLCYPSDVTAEMIRRYRESLAKP